MQDFMTKEYWDKRTLEGVKRNDFDTMIFDDARLKDYRARVGQILKSIKSDWTVLDIGCGFGFFADCFHPDQYTGIDFSKEMVNLAKLKYPDYRFVCEDIKNLPKLGKFDAVFEVNSGRVLYNNEHSKIQELLDKYARKATFILEADYVHIKYFGV